jgi:hypothetical protein
LYDFIRIPTTRSALFFDSGSFIRTMSASHGQKVRKAPRNCCAGTFRRAARTARKTRFLRAIAPCAVSRPLCRFRFLKGKKR